MTKQFVVDANIADIFKRQKKYAWNGRSEWAKDVKKTYVGIGEDKIVQRKKYDLYGNDMWNKRKSTSGLIMEDCEIHLIYFTNSSMTYNRIVYINPKNKTLVKKYLPYIMKSSDIISDWFLECKYNPQYKYCRDRLDKEYQDTIGAYEEVKHEEEQYKKICDDEDCEKMLTIDTPIMCWSKGEEEKTLCNECYLDGEYYKDDDNEDNVDSVEPWVCWWAHGKGGDECWGKNCGCSEGEEEIEGETILLGI